MKPAKPANESARLHLLHRLNILDTAQEAVYDTLTELACLICDCSNAALTLIAEDYQWIKAATGPIAPPLSRDNSFCAHTILTPDQITYAPNTLLDARFADNPLSQQLIGSYTAVPLCPETGVAVGALCVFDTEPKPLTEQQRRGLQLLAKQATELLQSRLLHESLKQQSEQLEHERHRLDAIIRGTNLGTWEWRIDTGFTEFNGHWYNILGLNPDMPTNIDTWRLLLHPDDVPSTQQLLEQHFRGDTAIYDAKFRMRHTQGHWIWVHAVGKVMTYGEDGSPRLMFGTHRDISIDQARDIEREQSRSWLQAVINSSTEAALISTDNHGVIQLFNTGAERMLGYSADDVVGKSSPALFHDPAEIQRRAGQLSAEYEKAIDGFDVFVYKAKQGISETRQWTFVCRSGERKQVRLSVSAIRGEQGDVRGFLGVAIDITQLEQLHHALLLSEQRHRSMLENLPGVVYRCINDSKWTMLFISDEVQKLTGYPAKDFIRNKAISFAELTLAEDTERVRQVVNQDLAQQAQFTVEYRIRHANGSVRFIQELGRGIYDASGNLLYIDGFIWDVTERRETEKALRAGEKKLTSLYQLAPLGIVLSNIRQGQILTANPQLQTMIGSVEPPSHLEQVVVLSPNQQQDRLAKLLQTGSYGPCEIELLQANGHSLPVVLSEILLDTDADDLQVWTLLQDISERKRIETMKNQFVSMVSHELRTPLTAISGALGLVTAGALGPVGDAMAQMLDIAHDNSKKLTQLINDLLDIDKLVAGKMTFDMQAHRLHDLLDTSIRHNQPYADHYQIQLQFHAGDDAMVTLDNLRFQQVLSNLLSNAVKFSPSGGLVRIHTKRIGDQIRISVIDQGPGIPLAFRERIFEKFSQADSADARSKGGTGLGLAIVRELTQRMGGQIFFDSEEGIGTQFHLEFPASAIACPVEKHPLLLIEDEPQIASLLSQLLTRAGYQVHHAANLQQADLLLAQQPIELLTLDLHLPDGFAGDWLLHRRAQPDGFELPVLVISLDSPEQHPNLHALSGVQWLQKPIEPSQLSEKLALLQRRVQSV